MTYKKKQAKKNKNVKLTKLTFAEKNQNNEKLDRKKYDGELSDRSSTGRERPWPEHKTHNELLSLAYETLGDSKKASRLLTCSSYLAFEIEPDGGKKLLNANFCRVRLCPVCQWRRSLKVFAQVSSIVEFVEKKKNYGYLVLSLTVKNISGDNLSAEITALMKAWHRFINYKKISTVVKGYYRAMEITHNINPKSDSFDTFHPHFHCIFAVNKNYFSGHDYIRRSEFKKLWAKAAHLDYLPQLDIHRVKINDSQSVMAAIAECAKYTVKSSDYLIPDDWNLTTNTVKILDKALDKRRFVAFGGIFKDAKILLGLDDAEDGDLINLGNEDELLEKIETQNTEVYFWRSGYTAYIRGSFLDE